MEVNCEFKKIYAHILPSLFALSLSTARDLVEDILISFRSSRDFCSAAAFVDGDAVFFVVFGDDVILLSFSSEIDRDGAAGGSLCTDVAVVVLFLGVVALLLLPLPREMDR